MNSIEIMYKMFKKLFIDDEIYVSVLLVVAMTWAL